VRPDRHLRKSGRIRVVIVASRYTGSNILTVLPRRSVLCCPRPKHPPRTLGRTRFTLLRGPQQSTFRCSAGPVGRGDTRHGRYDLAEAVVCSGLPRAVVATWSTQNCAIRTAAFLNSTQNVMSSSYPTGAVGQHYDESQKQHETFHDPPVFDPYNTHHAQQPSYDLTAYREPYRDEPSYPVPQLQPVNPLGHIKEDSSPSPDEFNPTPRNVPYVHRLPQTSYTLACSHTVFGYRSSRNVRAWRYQQGRPLWARVSAKLWSVFTEAMVT
jgi:hypothetical protein